MENNDVKKVLTKENKILIIFSIIFIFLVVLIPLFQAAEKHKVDEMIRASEMRILELEDQSRIIESQIAFNKTPEALFDSHTIRSISYSDISATHLLAKSE